MQTGCPQKPYKGLCEFFRWRHWLYNYKKKTLKPIIKSYIQVPAMATDCLHTHRLSQHSTEQIRRFTWWLIWLPEWIKHLSHHSSPACHTEHWQLSPLNTNKDYRIWVLFLDFVYFKSNMIHMSGTSSRVLLLSNPDKRSIKFVVWKESAHSKNWQK